MRTIYLIEDNFENYLTAVFDGWNIDPNSFSIRSHESYIPDLLSVTSECVANIEKADRVREGVKKWGNEITWVCILRTFCYQRGDRNVVFDHLYLFLRTLFEFGPKAIDRLTLPCVLTVNKYSKCLGTEIHRLHGLIRFQELSDKTLFAIITPDHAVLPFLEAHFRRRYPNERWAIYDQKRKKILLHTQNQEMKFETSIADLDEFELTDDIFSEREVFFQNLFKEYHKTIAIKERTNKKVQRSFMPKRYWNNLVEGDLE